MSACDICVYTDRHGHWPDLSVIHCDECHASWTGVNRQHCTVCHETFSSPNSAGLAHDGEGCFDPESVGLHLNDRGIWSRPGPGEWVAKRESGRVPKRRFRLPRGGKSASESRPQAPRSTSKPTVPIGIPDAPQGWGRIEELPDPEWVAEYRARIR